MSMDDAQYGKDKMYEMHKMIYEKDLRQAHKTS